MEKHIIWRKYAADMEEGWFCPNIDGDTTINEEQCLLDERSACRVATNRPL